MKKSTEISLSKFASQSKIKFFEAFGFDFRKIILPTFVKVSNDFECLLSNGETFLFPDD